jgi:hypothetical protein
MYRRLEDSRGSTEAEAENDLWDLELPIVVDQLLSSRFTDGTLVTTANAFLQYIAKRLADQMRVNKFLSRKKVKLLMKVLGSDERQDWFYTHFGQGFPDFDSYLPGSLQLAGPVMRYLPTSAPLPDSREITNATSKLWYANMNCFGQDGGFEAMLGVFAASEAKGEQVISLSSLADFIYFVTNLSSKMSSSFGRDYATKFLDASFNRLLNLGATATASAYYHTTAVPLIDESPLGPSSYKDYKDTARNSVDIILQNLKYFCTLQCKQYPVHERTETFRCVFSFFLLQAPSLSTRVAGASLLSSLTEAINDQHSSSAAKRPLQLHWLTEATFVKWLLQESNPTLGILLGRESVLAEYGIDAVHNEVLKRTRKIFEFLATRRLLSLGVLDSLWALSKASDDPPLQRTALEIIGAVSSYLPDSLLAVIGERIETPTTVVHIEFIAYLLRNILKSSTDEEGANRFGFRFLWEAVLSGNGDELSDQASLAIGSLMAGGIARDFVLKTALKCVAGIRAKTSAVALTKTLQFIVERQVTAPDSATFRVQGKAPLTRATLLQQLEKDAELTNVLVESTCSSLDGSGSGDDPSQPASFSSCALTVGLKLLRLVLESSGRELTAQEIERLWSHAVQTGRRDAADTLVAWIGAVCPCEPTATAAKNVLAGAVHPVGAAKCLSDGAVRSVFRLMTEDTESLVIWDMDTAGFATVEKLFRFMNYRNKAMAQSSSMKLFTVATPANLLGLQSLLKVYLAVGRDDVAKAIGEFLVLLHTRIEACGAKRLMLVQFAVDCIEVLRSTAKSDAEGGAHPQERILALLLQHLTKITESNYKQQLPSGYTRVFVFVHRDNRPARMIPGGHFITKESTLVGSLRAKVARVCRVAPGRVQMTARKYPESPKLLPSAMDKSPLLHTLVNNTLSIDVVLHDEPVGGADTVT